jgi:hypothetical protein
MNLDLTDRDLEVIRLALRQKQEDHRKGGFFNLAIECAELRSKISDYVLDKIKSKV